MDWATYKQLVDTPGIWSRWMLEQTLELLQDPQLSEPSLRPRHESLEAQLQASLRQTPLPKPPDHKGGSNLDMLALQLAQSEARSLLELVQRAVELGITTGATTKRGLGGFVAAWQEYLTSIDSQN